MFSIQRVLTFCKIAVFNFFICVMNVFTVRLHVMQHTVLMSEFCLSVRPSVCPSDACIVTKLNDALRIF